MIRFVVAALWIVAATIGSIFFAFSATGVKEPVDEQAEFLKSLEYLKTEMMSVPVIRGGQVQGYFLTRLVYAVEPEKMKTLSVPVDTLLIDHLYTYLFSNPQLDFSKTDRLDLDVLRNGLRDSINARVGDALVHDIMVQQIDYLSKEQIRDNALRRRDDPKGGDKRAVLRSH